MTEKEIVLALIEYRKWLVIGVESEDFAYMAKVKKADAAYHDGASKAFKEAKIELDRLFSVIFEENY